MSSSKTIAEINLPVGKMKQRNTERCIFKSYQQHTTNSGDKTCDCVLVKIYKYLPVDHDCH